MFYGSCSIIPQPSNPIEDTARLITSENSKWSPVWNLEAWWYVTKMRKESVESMVDQIWKVHNHIREGWEIHNHIVTVHSYIVYSHDYVLNLGIGMFCRKMFLNTLKTWKHFDPSDLEWHSLKSELDFTSLSGVELSRLWGMPGRIVMHQSTTLPAVSTGHGWLGPICSPF